MKTTVKFWIGLVLLIILSPLGLIIPKHFKAGSAWGEWGTDEIQQLLGYLPKGLGKLSSFWKAPLPDYGFKSWEGKGGPYLSFAYIISALAGVGLVLLIAWLIGKTLVKKDDQ